ncbi:Tyrosine-protein kinase EpsD [hydrothermal vent metagenome]|uniref:non-specific protein-tyrosine kinase n=1 Tax=hydrothermal vent metagenome TaxID=652676 RepID=A0A1W1C5Z4_9ZZZZ
MNSSSPENYIIELFKRVTPYKWSILFIMVLFIALMQLKLYFTPSVYESYAIIKVKVNENKVDSKDLLRDSLFKTNTVGINQEMAILQTFQTNKKALEKVNFQVKYFIKEGYKKVEIYNNLPIRLHHITKINPKFINHDIKVKPLENGFSLSSNKEKNSTIYSYDKEVVTPFFTGVISKTDDFITPITIKLQGDIRHIYENIIKNSLSVSQLKLDTNLIKVAFQDTIPQRANEYIDALVDAYINRSITKKNMINSKILEFLDERLSITKKKLEISENKLEKYQSKNKNIDPSLNSKDSYGKLSDIELQLSEIQLKEQLINNLIIFIKHNRNLNSIAPTLLEFNAQSTLKLITDIQNLQIKEDSLKLEFTNRYPPLVQLRKRIRSIRKQISLNVKNLKTTLNFKRKSLLKQKEKYEKILTLLPEKEKNYINFKRNYEVNSKIYTYLLEKKSENELVKVATISDYEAIDRAYASSIPVKPKRMVLLIIAGVVGLGFGVVLALIRSLTKKKIYKLQEIEERIKLPFYGKIPLFDEKMGINIAIEEAYKQLAINLQFSKKKHEGNIVLVTSTIRGEGKTTTVINLSSILFRKTKYRSILVDLNMIEPSLHTHFNMDLPYSGMSTYLSTRDNLGNIIFDTSYPNLDIITAGPIPPDPAELLSSSSELEELFIVLKERYDYIFIDTPSFEELPEVLDLVKYADKSLIVLRENVTTKASLEKLEEAIKEKNLKNIGLVFKLTVKMKKKDLKTPPLISQQNVPKQLM